MIKGYARVITDGQEFDTQRELLRAAGTKKIFTEKKSGIERDRKALAKM